MVSEITDEMKAGIVRRHAERIEHLEAGIRQHAICRLCKASGIEPNYAERPCARCAGSGLEPWADELLRGPADHSHEQVIGGSGRS